MTKSAGDDEVVLDLQRKVRMGLEEAVLCGHKSVSQICVILERVRAAGRSIFLTRLDEATFAALPSAHLHDLDYDALSQTASYRRPLVGRVVDDKPRIAIVTAGSSDARVAQEAARTLAYAGVAVQVFHDVGVAGLWRILEKADALREMDVVICVAGMDAALPSVVGGLVGGLVIAVPTSTGYGVAAGGTTALHACLASCASGVVVVNIDNGYGAASAALRALRAP